MEEAKEEVFVDIFSEQESVLMAQDAASLMK